MYWFYSYDNLLCKELTRNPEIGNTPVLVLPNIRRLARVRNTKFGTNVSSEMLLNTAKCQGYSFYRFWVIKGKRGREGGKITPSQIRVKMTSFHNGGIKFWDNYTLYLKGIPRGMYVPNFKSIEGGKRILLQSKVPCA